LLSFIIIVVDRWIECWIYVSEFEHFSGLF